MSSASTFASRFSITSSLSDTLAPPRTATNGPLRALEHAAEVLDLLRHQQPGRRLLDVMDDALGRGVRAVRRAERVVDVDVGEQRRAASRTPDRSSLPRRGTAGSRAAPRRRLAGGDRRAAPARRRSRRRTAPAGRRAAATAARRPASARIPGWACPSAARGATRGSPWRPRSSSVLIVGSDARMRVSSVIAPFLIGTLKSTRTNDPLARDVEVAIESSRGHAYRPFFSRKRSRSTQRLE